MTTRCKRTGRLKNPTKSGRKCRKRIKCKNGNLKTHIKRRQCRKKVKCSKGRLKRRTKTGRVCRKNKKISRKYSRVKRVKINTVKPQPIKINTSNSFIMYDVNNNDPVESNEWACVNPYNPNNYTESEFNNSCIQGGTPKPGYEKLPRNMISCKRMCIK